MNTQSFVIEAVEARRFFSDGGVAYDPPITITQGGTYSGNWQSLDADVAAVTIETDEQVVIRNSRIRSRGDLIKTHVVGADIVIRNTRGYGLNPDVRGQAPGRFLKAEHFSNVLVKNSYLKGTSGIYVYDYRGESDEGDTVRVIGNIAINIDGRRSDGRGGFLAFNRRTRISDGWSETGFHRVQFVQLNQVRRVPDIEIAWNRVTNQPGKSRVEDNISIFHSSGTRRRPIRIHDNYIRGAYTIKPWQDDRVEGNWRYDWGYSGGGIMLGDGYDSAFVRAYDNHVVATSNYGIAIFGGHDLKFHDNRVVASGVLDDGRPIVAQNVGIYIWDGEDTGTDRFYNNVARNNLVGWINADGRNDWWFPDATTFAGNQPWPGDEITRETEAAELSRWREQALAAGISIGPLD